MIPIRWTDDLALGFEPLDQMHRDFIGVLARAQTADDATLPEAWNRVVAQACAQFDVEDARMRDTGFAAANAHITQHRVVLNVLREGIAHARQGRLDAVREMADELASWFCKHTQTHDAALALHLRRHSTPDMSPPPEPLRQTP